MNIAAWLYRAGLSHPGFRRSVTGRAWCRATAHWPNAPRGSPMRCMALGLKPGDRVAIVAEELRRISSRPIYGIWHGGLRGGAGERQAARPRAWLHPRAFRRARMLRDAGARRRDRAACAGKPRTPDRHRQPRIRSAVRRRPDAGRAARRRRSRLAVLYLRHHRPAERRDAHPSRAGAGELCVSDRSRSRPRRAMPSCTPRR